MAATTWDRATATGALRPRLWRYLSGASTVTFAESAAALNLPELPRADLLRLFATHLALRPETSQALDAAGRLLAELPSSLGASRVELYGEVRGQVDWTRTVQRRVALADPTVFVCTPPERRYDTPLGRLLRLSLWCAAQLSSFSGVVPNGTVGRAVAETSDTARRLLLHPKLSKVRRIEPAALRHPDALVARRPYLAPLVALVTDFWAGMVEGSPQTLASMLERSFLAPASDAALFELQVGFDLIDGLEQAGYQLQQPVPLLPGGKLPFAQLGSSAGLATIWWQRPAWVLAPAGAAAGTWSRVLADNGLSRHPLRPDFVIDFPAGRRILVEVKLTALAEGSPERDGLRDVLAYLEDAQSIFVDRPPPHALVVAWNATGRPTSTDVRIQVASQDSLLGTWSQVVCRPGQPRL